jgi:hypothetical protein
MWTEKSLEAAFHGSPVVRSIMYCQGEKFKLQTEKSLRECLDGVDAQLSTNVSASIRSD